MSSPTNQTIQPQVKLPFSVALEVVLQGIRIRMGRSIVTMMGVVLGVAFLMSVLCSNTIKKSMAKESEIRVEVQRMLSFLESDAGSIEGRNLAVYSTGKLSEIEQRLLAHLQKQGVSELRYFQSTVDTKAPRLKALVPFDNVKGIGENASALLLMGEGTISDSERELALVGMRQKVVASTRTELLSEQNTDHIQVRLERVLQPEQAQRLAQQAAQAKVRNIWIITIALLVTVIGITNSLLMSVTERFKEIGTMKCLGALSSFIRRIFFIESALTGLVGSLIGGLLGFVVASVIYAFTFGFGLVFLSIDYGTIAGLYAISLACGVAMSILAAIYPASFASRMIPATALRTNI